MQNLFELCEEVGIKLRRLSKKARTVGFYLSGDMSFHGRKTYKEYFDTGSEMFGHLINLADVNKMKYVRRIGIWASGLEDRENVQQSLFDSAKKNSLQETIDEINDRFGDHTIRNGFLLYADKLTTVPNGYMADRFERSKIATRS